MKRFLAALALMGGLLTVSNAANAQSIIRNPEDHSHIGIDVHGAFDYWWGYGFGGGVRVEIPLVHSGFIGSLNNSFGLSLGADGLYRGGYYANYGYGWFSLVAHVDAQWNFYLTPKWSVFAEAGFAPEFWIGGCPYASCQWFWPWFDVGVGGRYHFGSGNNGNPALILRLTNTMANFGVEF